MWRPLTFLILCLFFVGTTVAAQSDVPITKKEVRDYKKLLETKYILLPHKGTFLLPFVYNQKPHEDLYANIKSLSPEKNKRVYKNAEAEFQVSFMFPVLKNLLTKNLELDFAYTHHAWWQVYNSEWSRPFRETNYMPELFIRYLEPSVASFASFDFMGVDLGYVHQSNGQIQLLSRSWDRLYARTYLQSKGFLIFLTGWLRLPEAGGDDNPDIRNYMGNGEFEVTKPIGEHAFSIKLPLQIQHFSLDLKYSYPWKDRLRWYLSMQQGYGHSLIEYNRYTQRYGVGIILDDFIFKTN